jgi:hypothetical protein
MSQEWMTDADMISDTESGVNGRNSRSRAIRRKPARRTKRLYRGQSGRGSTKTINYPSDEENTAAILSATAGMAWFILDTFIRVAKKVRDLLILPM